MITFKAISLMEKLTRTVLLLGGILIFLLLSHQALAEAQEHYVIKFATLAPEGSPWMNTFHEVNGEIKKKTEGKVTLKAYPGGVLGEDRDMLRKMRIGQIHAGGFTGSGLCFVNRDITVIATPFLFRDYGEVDYVLGKMEGRFKRGFEKEGYVLLGWSEIGFAYLLSNVPVSSVEEIRGAKVWSIEGDPLASPVLRKAGVTPIPLGIADVLMALQTNLIDVVYAPPLAAIALQWFTKVKYMTNLPLIYSLGGVLVSKAVFDKIPFNLQEIVKEVFQRHTSLLNERTRRDNDEAIRVMVKQGIKLVTPNHKETEEFKRISLEAIDELAGKAFSKDVFAEMRSHIDQYRKARKGK
jgi:TRAP-type C4-dicarboxylate transport system substrate-binding protein